MSLYKKIFILMLSIFLLFVINNICFASWDTTTAEDSVYLISNTNANEGQTVKVPQFSTLLEYPNQDYIITYSSSYYCLSLIPNNCRVINVNNKGKDFKVYDDSNNIITFTMYKCKWNSGSWTLSSSSQIPGEVKEQLYYNTDIYNSDGSLFFDNPNNNIIEYSITLSTTEITFDKIRAYSNWFSLTDLSKYEVYVSTDTINWEYMHYQTLTDAETGSTDFRFYWDIYQNGFYYFKFLNTETNEEEYISYTILNIGYDIFFSTEETAEPIYCYSNTFTYDTMWVYISKDGVNWESMNTEFVDYNTGDIMNSTERFWHYITENRNILF